jgi:hypothetical protein
LTGIALLGRPLFDLVAGKLPAGREELRVDGHIATMIRGRGERQERERRLRLQDGG